MNRLLLKHIFCYCLCIVTLINCSSEKISDEHDSEKDTEFIGKIEGVPETFNSQGDVYTIKVYSNKDWTLSSKQNWIHFSLIEGESKIESPVEVKITAEYNFEDNREAEITLSAKGSSAEGIKYKIIQNKNQRPKTKYKVGDPEVTFDEVKFNENYIYNTQMQTWRKAGVGGGIPHIEEQLANVTKVFEAGTSAKEINDYFASQKYKKVIVLLKNGNYVLDQGIRIYSNATLIGESRDGVIMTISPKISPKTYGVLSLFNANRAGLRNVTIVGGWLNEDGENHPKYDNFGHEELPGMGSFITVNLKGTDGKNSFVDNVKIINSASHPIWTDGSNHTIRDVEIDGAFCKAEGCQGYFFIDGNKHLITGCKVTRIRHISFQNPKSKQNVFYDNDLRQEITFHNNDGGDNLIENNRIYLPETMSGSYNAIMGPWSNQHKVGGKNFIYNNKCKENNRNGETPWSDNQLYLGPYEVSVGADNPNRHTNFRPVDIKDFPSGGTLYPVVLE